MKSSIFVLTLVVLSNVASAQSKQQFLQKILDLNGRTGIVASNFEERSSGECTIEVQPDPTDGTLSVFFRDTGFYFTPVAHVFEDAEMVDSNTLLVSTDPRRAGGDKCGDFGGAIRYKKTLILEKNNLTISESFRCTLAGFKKYELISTCSF